MGKAKNLPPTALTYMVFRADFLRPARTAVL